MKHNRFRCIACQKEFAIKDIIPFDLITPNVGKIILESFPTWSENSYICLTDLNLYRSEYIKKSISEDREEISELEDSVINSLREHESISENINDQFDESITFGERLSDKIAEFGGSWKFIILFFSVLSAWILMNALKIFGISFDPYPFILLNLILSCLASIQAPIIMMSQNRQSMKDRLRAEMDYKINLKAELEIRHLKTKLDQLSSHQWQRLLEIQQLQTELIQEVIKTKNSRS